MGQHEALLDGGEAVALDEQEEHLGLAGRETLGASGGLEALVWARRFWRDAFGSDYPQACVVAKKEVVEKNKKFVDAFLKKLAETEGWAEAHPTEAVETVGAHTDGTGSTLTALDAGIVKRCNIKHVSAQMHDKDFEKPPLAKKPDDGFYYKA